MNVADYLTGITFNQIQPDAAITPDQLAGSVRPPHISNSVIWDLINTNLPENEKVMKERLGSILEMPRMSTFGIAAIINHAVSQLSSEEAFVNVGVWHGFTLLAGMINNQDKICIGIDNFSEFSGHLDSGKEANLCPPVPISFYKRFNHHRSPQHGFHEMDYEEYFEKVHQGPIGLYMYDGEHSYKNQLRGLQVAEKFFAPHCLVLVDDTNKNETRQATLDFIERSSLDYEIMFDKKTSCGGHPTFWNGIMIFRRTGDAKTKS